MYSWVHLEKLREWTHGKAAGAWSDFPVKAIGTDTRALKKGDVFLALRGEKFDANDFLEAAVKGGASAVITHREAKLPVPVLVVPDTLKALIAIGTALRDAFEGPVVGITGSAGKSSTKEMVAALLGPDTVASPASFNNLMGVSRTLCLVTDSTRRLILELGMNDFGEIAELCESFRPRVGCLTNIGDAHIGKLGGKDGIFRAKKELFDYLASAPDTIGVALNLDDPLVEQAYQEAFRGPVPTVTYTLTGELADVSVSRHGIDPTTGFLNLNLSIRGSSFDLSLPLFGMHHAQNAAAATAIALVLGLSEAELVGRYQTLRPARHRGEIVNLKLGPTLIDESYNSNPTALGSSLASLGEISPTRRRVMVIGDMFELGEFGPALHAECGVNLASQLEKKKAPFALLGVGKEVSHLVRPVAEKFPKAEVHRVDSERDVDAWLLSRLQPSDVLLVKGSRGVQLDRLVQRITEHYGELPYPAKK